MTNKEKIFLAGATGMVGTSILTDLLRNHPTLNIKAVYTHTQPFIFDDRIEYVQGDFTSQDNIREIISGSDRVVMAALAHGGGAGTLTNEPWNQIVDNITMFSNILEACHFEGVKRIVWIGSATLYQEFDGFIKENELIFDCDPHPSHFCIGWVMRFAEKLCQFWRTQGPMQIINVRAANIYGPYARFDPNRSNFIPAIIRKAVKKMDPFQIWGSPDVTRDVIFAEDFARAISLLLLNESLKSDTFNIGSGIKTTVDEVVHLSLKSANHSPKEIQYQMDKPSTIQFRGLDSSKIMNKTGWRPEYTIEEGIRITTDWWMNNKEVWKK